MRRKRCCFMSRVIWDDECYARSATYGFLDWPIWFLSLEFHWQASCFMRICQEWHRASCRQFLWEIHCVTALCARASEKPDRQSIVPHAKIQCIRWWRRGWSLISINSNPVRRQNATYLGWMMRGFDAPALITAQTSITTIATLLRDNAYTSGLERCLLEAGEIRQRAPKDIFWRALDAIRLR